MRALVACLLIACGAVAPARAQSSVVLAGPGSFATTYTTIFAVSSRADHPVLVNQDLAYHDLRSLTVGGDDEPWCGPADPTLPPSASNPRRFALGACPLFLAELTVPLTGSAPIDGLAAAEPGKTYAFVCSVHPSMRGLLAITD